MRSVMLAFCLFLVCINANAESSDELATGDDGNYRMLMLTQISAAWRNSDFDTLERMAEEYMTKRTKTVSGKSSLSLFDLTLTSMLHISWPKEFGIRIGGEGCPEAPNPRYYPDADSEWDRIGAKADAWISKYPRSPHAIMLKTSYFIQRAWFYRGRGFVRCVPDQAWPLLNAYFARARLLLESTREISVKSPIWFERMLFIASVQSWPKSESDALIQDFLVNGQNYSDAYQAAFSALQPKWGGSFAAMDAFARDAAARTRNEQGAGLYTRLYWNLYSQYRTTIFSETMLDWGMMRQGFLDIIARYPDSRNLNAFAMFACIARDYVTAAEVLKKMGDGVLLSFWQDVSLPVCRRASGVT